MCRNTLFICLAVVIAGGFGCFQQHCTNDADLSSIHALCINPHCSYDPNDTIAPPPGDLAAPTTVEDTKREPRYLTLREAIAIALENGTVGVQNAATPGISNDGLQGLVGTSVGTPDAIRALSLDPAILQTNIEVALSKFDAFWNTSAIWNHTDSPIGTNPSIFGFGIPGVNLGQITQNNVTVATGIEKPLPTGGVAGITFSDQYLASKPSAALGSTHQPDLQLSFEQPLLQGFGIEINQLRESHPGSLLNPFPVLGGPVEGILITRIRFNQGRAEFDRNLNYMLLNVEGAYWNLYGAYFQLFSREEGMRYAYESWRLTKLGLDAGRATEQALAQARLQYELFRSQRLQALGQVLETERQLRALLGLKVEDGQRLIPTDKPTLTPVQPNWRSALDDCLAKRPELIQIREELRARQLTVIKEKNLLLPDLRFIATTDLHSIGGDLDGGPTSLNANHNLVTDPFVNWTLGFRMNVPIGYRAANANLRAAKLGLERTYISLRTDENKAELFLGLAYRQVQEYYDQIVVNQAAYRAATLQLEKYYELFRQGRGQPFGADVILAQRDWSNSLSSLFTAVVQYNNALATLEFAKGTIMEHDGVYVADGPMPYCAQMRAVEHEKQRTHAIVLKECDQCRGRRLHVTAGDGDVPSLPEIPANEALSIPAVQQDRQPVPDITEARPSTPLLYQRTSVAADGK